MLVAQNSLGPVCPVPLTVRGMEWQRCAPYQTQKVAAVKKKCACGSGLRAMERKGPCLYVCTDGSRRACGVGDCPRLVPTPGASRETSGPRIHRIPPTRQSYWDRQYRELKKLIFLAPSTCPIDLFGPVANGTVLKRLHVASCNPSTSVPSGAKPKKREAAINRCSLTSRLCKRVR